MTTLYLGLEDNINMLPSSPNPRSFSISSASSSSTTQTPPYRTLTPKPDATSPMSFAARSFEDSFLGLRERKIHNGQSIAPNLLSIKSESIHEAANPPIDPVFQHHNHNHNHHNHHNHNQHPQHHQNQHPQHIGNILHQQHQQSFAPQHYEQAAYPRMTHYPEYVPQRYSSNSLSPSSSSNGDSLCPPQSRIPSIFDCSQSFASWGHGSNSRGACAAITALELLVPKAGISSEGEEDADISDRDSAGSSPMPAITRRKRRASRPLVVTSRDKPHVCSVGGCGGRFKRPEHLRRHEKTHTNERPFACTICGREFGRNDNLKTHKKTHMKLGGRNEYIPGLA